MNQCDIDYLRQALALGERAKGNTGDNPWVGCVIVRDGEVIAEGFTGAPGEPHAEASAIIAAENSGRSVAGATVYCTLEPCSFHGRTPSCAKTLVEKKVGRVVFGIRDPHPRVNGLGVEILREAGIIVEEGVLDKEIEASLSGWLQNFSSH